MALTGKERANGAAGEYGYDRCDRLTALKHTCGGSVLTEIAYAYGPYGEVLAQTGDWRDNPFTFMGAHGVTDEGAGLFYTRFRYYDAPSGRFIQEDPLGLWGDSNLYRYASGNPATYVDPLGLQAKGASWWRMYYGVTNVVYGGGALALSGALVAVSVLDPTALPTWMLRKKLIFSVGAYGTKMWVRGFKQIQEGWEGKEMPTQTGDLFRMTPLSTGPTTAASYLLEGRGGRAAYELAKVKMGPAGDAIELGEELAGQPLSIPRSVMQDPCRPPLSNRNRDRNELVRMAQKYSREYSK